MPILSQLKKKYLETSFYLKGIKRQRESLDLSKPGNFKYYKTESIQVLHFSRVPSNASQVGDACFVSSM